MIVPEDCVGEAICGLKKGPFCLQRAKLSLKKKKNHKTKITKITKCKTTINEPKNAIENTTTNITMMNRQANQCPRTTNENKPVETIANGQTRKKKNNKQKTAFEKLGKAITDHRSDESNRHIIDITLNRTVTRIVDQQ